MLNHRIFKGDGSSELNVQYAANHRTAVSPAVQLGLIKVCEMSKM